MCKKNRYPQNYETVLSVAFKCISSKISQYWKQLLDNILTLNTTGEILTIILCLIQL